MNLEEMSRRYNEARTAIETATGEQLPRRNRPYPLTVEEVEQMEAQAAELAETKDKEPQPKKAANSKTKPTADDAAEE